MPAEDPAPPPPPPFALADPVAALALLTRLPLPGRLLAAAAPRGAAAGWAYPLAGAVVGGIAALALGLAGALGLGAGPAAGLALAAAVIVTGGLHEDGLADAACCRCCCAGPAWPGWRRPRPARRR